MGRFYYGDIEGKFWFGIQESEDASHFGSEAEENYCYLVCGCCYEEGKSYCKGCYSSKEEHYEATKEDCDNVDEDGEYTELDNNISYYFSEDDKETIEEKLDELFDTLTNDYDFDFDNFTLEIDESGYKADWSQIKDVSEECLPLLARYCLGKQILECINRNGDCSFYCEL